MPDLLLEFFSEEIPARMQPRAAEDLKKLVTDRLAGAAGAAGAAGVDEDVSAIYFRAPRKRGICSSARPSAEASEAFAAL